MPRAAPEWPAASIHTRRFNIDDPGNQSGQLSAVNLIELLCARLARAGHEVAVFDLTRPDIAFPVVRVVSPGLRDKARRLGPGRLYDVPVRMGWLRTSRIESEMAEAL